MTRETKLNLSWMLPCCRLWFIGLKMLCSLLGKNSHQQCHSGVDASSYCNDLPSNTCHDSYRLTNSVHCGLLHRREFPSSPRAYPKPMSGKDIGPNPGVTAVVLLNGYDVSVKLLSKYLGLCL